jgi:hypothetical protein
MLLAVLFASVTGTASVGGGAAPGAEYRHARAEAKAAP